MTGLLPLPMHRSLRLGLDIWISDSLQYVNGSREIWLSCRGFSTSVNEADHLTKVLDRTLFYRHVDHLMGHVPPLYSPCYGRVIGKEQLAMPHDITRGDMSTKPRAFVPVMAKCQVEHYFWENIVLPPSEKSEPGFSIC